MLIAAVLLLAPCAAKAKPITMICRGTDQIPWDGGAVLDLKARTFSVSIYWKSFVIKEIDERSIAFGADFPGNSVVGKLDRISGEMEIVAMGLKPGQPPLTITGRCTPAKKLF